jgi:hypothetical protein
VRIHVQRVTTVRTKYYTFRTRRQRSATKWKGKLTRKPSRKVPSYTVSDNPSALNPFSARLCLSILSMIVVLENVQVGSLKSAQGIDWLPAARMRVWSSPSLSTVRTGCAFWIPWDSLLPLYYNASRKTEHVMFDGTAK